MRISLATKISATLIGVLLLAFLSSGAAIVSAYRFEQFQNTLVEENLASVRAAEPGALFKLLVHSIVNIQNQGLVITFVTSNMYPRMLPFTLTRIGPYGDFCGETRGVTKALAVPATA